ncbi:MAG: ATP-binding protein [Calditrichaceae bacterium]
MKTFFRSYYAKLSAIFLFLLIILGTVQIWITVKTWNRYYSEADQKLNLHLASDMAAELSPFVLDTLNMNQIEHSIHYMMVLNPKIEIYLLDNTGKILAFFADPKKKVQSKTVNLEPVRKFIDETEPIPIFGDDPRHPGIKKPFSAAKLGSAAKFEGYLYIVIGGEQYESAQSLIRESYLARTLIRSLLITLIFTGVIGLILFAYLTRRLRKMNEVVKQFEDGHYKNRVQFKGTDELSQLSASFNAMADKIESNIEALKETDRLRRELVANVSHDLRSPLAALRGYLETIQMKDKKLNENQRQEYLDILLDTTSGLEKLVEDLFELSKLDAKQIKAHFEPFTIKDLIFDVVAKFKPKAQQKNIELKIDVPDGLPQVVADVGLIERVLSNLIENSIRYTPENGRINIFVVRENEHVRVKVADTGQGIEQDQLPHIFERFYRVEKSRAEDTGGSGLGLAIANKIMEVHNSKIDVESKINVGSTFSFELNTA